MGDARCRTSSEFLASYSFGVWEVEPVYGADDHRSRAAISVVVLHPGVGVAVARAMCFFVDCISGNVACQSVRWPRGSQVADGVAYHICTDAASCKTQNTRTDDISHRSGREYVLPFVIESLLKQFCKCFQSFCVVLRSASFCFAVLARFCLAASCMQCCFRCLPSLRASGRCPLLVPRTRCSLSPTCISIPEDVCSRRLVSGSCHWQPERLPLLTARPLAFRPIPMSLLPCLFLWRPPQRSLLFRMNQSMILVPF